MIHPRVRIKMCGMTRANDIAYAVSLGVDAVGFIFYQQSRRHLSVLQATDLLKGLPAFVDAVAVFVNPDASLVKQVLSALPIQYLQFHGEESPQFCEQFGVSYIKAIPAMSAAMITTTVQQYPKAAAILLDTPSMVSRGGSGVPFDWKVIPKQLSTPIILAGGLDHANVNSAVTACAPYAVDVCSGIEASVGIKDHQKMSQFVSQLWGQR